MTDIDDAVREESAKGKARILTSRQHRAAAEIYLSRAEEWAGSDQDNREVGIGLLLQKAQVHATLALAPDLT